MAFTMRGDEGTGEACRYGYQYSSPRSMTL